MFPGVLSVAFDDLVPVWFMSSIVFAAVHLVSLTWFLAALARLGFSAFRPFERRIITVCIPFAVLLVICQLAVVVGSLRAFASLVYHLGIFWYLLISGIAFSFMLFPRAERSA